MIRISPDDTLHRTPAITIPHIDSGHGQVGLHITGYYDQNTVEVHLAIGDNSGTAGAPYVLTPGQALALASALCTAARKVTS